MTTGTRRLTLVTHVILSVGWFGAVAVFLAFAIAGLASRTPQTAQAAYVSMDLLTWGVIVPFALAALLTGIVASLGTTWGLFRHYWVVAKLIVTVAATAILLVHTQPIGRVATAARDRMLASGDLHPLRIQLIADAGAALFAIVIATALSVYKPWGLTRYGERVAGAAPSVELRWKTNAVWTWVWLVAILGAIALFVAAHLLSSGAPHH